MYVCLYLYMYVCMYVCMYVAFMYVAALNIVCMYVCMYVCSMYVCSICVCYMCVYVVVVVLLMYIVLWVVFVCLLLCNCMLLFQVLFKKRSITKKTVESSPCGALKNYSKRCGGFQSLGCSQKLLKNVGARPWGATSDSVLASIHFGVRSHFGSICNKSTCR
jgi:hypothetical protein